MVSVKPFGGDDSLPTAKRPSDKKVNIEITKPKTIDIIVKDEKTEVSLKSIKKISEDQIPSCEKRQTESQSLEKIVDMPLITSANLVSVIQNEEVVGNESQETIQKNTDSKSEKRISIARTPAIKKPENEKPRICVQNSYNNKGEYAVTKITKRTDIMNSENRTYNSGIELTLTPLKKETNEDRSILVKGKDVNKITVSAAEEKTKDTSLLEERKVEGEVGKKFNFEESRESAGEPDGKADEDISEPPALPKSPPPVEVKTNRCSLQSEPKCMLTTAEPRTSFLHGESKIKPLVPQKPSTFSPKNSTSSTSTTTYSTFSNTPTVPTLIKNSLLSSFAVPPIQNPASQNKVNQASSRAISNEVKDHSAARIFNYSNTTMSENKNTDQSQNTTYKIPQQVQSCQNAQVELPSKKEENSKPKENVSKTFGLGPPRPKPPTISFFKTLQTEEDVEIDDEDLENADLQAELVRSPNKRRMAPKPPASPADEVSASLFARNPTTVTKSDSPVVREKEKRERASSCSPKFRKAVCEAPDPSIKAPEPAPRRNISLSQDSLANPERIEEKKKSRSRFSLKKFLRMGTRKDVDMTCGSGGSKMDEIPSTPQPKPRLEIIHPLELDGAAVQVLGNEGHSRVSEDVTDSRNDGSLTSFSQMTNGVQHITSKFSALLH